MGNIRIDGFACVSGAVAILIFPINWLMAACAAAIIHEMCHILVLMAVHGKVYSLRILFPGAVLETGALSHIQELLCALAGPLGSIGLFLAGTMWPRIALCALIQGAFNMIPVYPLDGGRILKSGLFLLMNGKNVDRICCLVEWICGVGILLAGIVGALLCQLGIAPLLLAGILTARIFRGKIPCKVGKVSVQ